MQVLWAFSFLEQVGWRLKKGKRPLLSDRFKISWVSVRIETQVIGLCVGNGPWAEQFSYEKWLSGEPDVVVIIVYVSLFDFYLLFL